MPIFSTEGGQGGRSERMSGVRACGMTWHDTPVCAIHKYTNNTYMPLASWLPQTYRLQRIGNASWCCRCRKYLQRSAPRLCCRLLLALGRGVSRLEEEEERKRGRGRGKGKEKEENGFERGGTNTAGWVSTTTRDTHTACGEKTWHIRAQVARYYSFWSSWDLLLTVTKSNIYNLSEHSVFDILHDD